MPLRGSRRARLRTVHLVDSYGQRCYHITFSHQEAPGELRSTQISTEAVYPDPHPGDNVYITYSMGKPTGIYLAD